MTPRVEQQLQRIPWEDLKWLVPIVMAILSMFGSSFIAYTNNDKAIAEDLATLQERQSATERQRGDDLQRLIRIEDKLDRLVERGLR